MQVKKRKKLESLKAYLSDYPFISELVWLCRLDPVGNSWKNWQDGAGWKLSVTEDKTIHITRPKKLVLCVDDIYYKAAPATVVQKSQKISILYDTAHHVFYLACIGKDDRIRAIKVNNSITAIHPLEITIDALETLMGYKESNALWITDYPVDNAILDTMTIYNKKQTDLIITKLLTK